MAFPKCARCVAAGIAGTCAFATVHPQGLCGQFDLDGVYCVKLVAELPHGPHHDRPLSGSISWIKVSGFTAPSSSTGLEGGSVRLQHEWRVIKT